MQIYFAWGIFIAACAAARLYLMLLPTALDGARAGLPDTVFKLRWLGLMALLGLAAWPIFAGIQLDGRRWDPSMLTLILTTLGGLALAWLLSQLVATVVLMSAPGDLEAAVTGYFRHYGAFVAWGLLALTVVAYWAASRHGYHVLVECTRRYGC